MTEAPFQIATLSLFLALTVLRVTYHRKAGTMRRREEMREGIRREGAFRWVRPLVGLPYLVIFVTWLISPSLLAWSRLPLPAALRWAGLAIGMLGLILLLWVHDALGRNFSGTLALRADHELVTSGPYRWVRHPMYTSFILVFLAFSLLTANALIAFMSAAVLVALIVDRTPKEEGQLAARFGEQYESYRSRTGLLFPRLW